MLFVHLEAASKTFTKYFAILLAPILGSMRLVPTLFCYFERFKDPFFLFIFT
jgi:hypothetical protein